MHTSLRWPARSAVTLCAALFLTSCGDDHASPAPEPEPEQETAPATPEGSEENPSGDDSAEESSDSSTEPFAEADLMDVAGNEVGHVSFTSAEEDAGVRVRFEARNLGPGFRGVSIHESGLCEVQSVNEWGQIGDFYSAGGHLQGELEPDTGVVEGEDELESVAPEEEPANEHPDRAGNLPNLLINQDESGQFEVVTDRLSEELLLEGDGTAVIIHSQPDHHGNLPERYAPYGPDDESRATGDTGDRLACGVVDEVDN